MIRDVGGEHRFEIGQEVLWQGSRGKVISLTVEPSVSIEFPSGRRLTVGQSVVTTAPKESPEDQRARILSTDPYLSPKDYDLAIALGYPAESWEGMWRLSEKPFSLVDGHIIAHEVVDGERKPVVHDLPQGWTVIADQKLTATEVEYVLVSPREREWGKPADYLRKATK